MKDPVIPFDQLTRYVRVRSEPDARFVEFDFAIGHPELFVELVLPHAAFAAFCQQHQVGLMNAAMCQAGETAKHTKQKDGTVEMSVEIKTNTVKPLRHTYGNLQRRFGDKPASRYQEASYDIEATTNFHYRPLWAPQRQLNRSE